MFLPTVRKSESIRSLSQLLVFHCPLRRPYKGPCVPKDALESLDVEGPECSSCGLPLHSTLGW